MSSIKDILGNRKFLITQIIVAGCIIAFLVVSFSLGIQIGATAFGCILIAFAVLRFCLGDKFRLICRNKNLDSIGLLLLGISVLAFSLIIVY